eukprot:CAMPEP_0178374380 /NCGR_PEP_ID=MMETSP0689_2-20121128/2347_1 /TAXON_ID=160604 /ORGANISM="Amphidinium massartii, Strain CS-259" /LENGTH=1121 /DNA_ID=CAMNT_0019994349 /DNA_START=70 /DNA_END=3431 /DNA_ORIENTATION=-
MRLTVVYTNRASCFVAIHPADAESLWKGHGSGQHFCRVLACTASSSSARTELYLGWRGEAALGRATLEIAQPFAACFGLHDGQMVEVVARPSVPVAKGIMVQPRSIDDFEVVELSAAYIEEHLLEQVAVLAPSVAFPVWIHGQAPVYLQVDALDENAGPCFLLSVDTELMVETKQRKSRVQAWSRGEASLQQELSLRLRVHQISQAMSIPSAHLHPDDLSRLLGQDGIDSGTCWLQVGSRSAEGRASATPPFLFKASIRRSVPRHHILLAGCLAEWASVPLYSFVSVWRCRHVPVYVPRIELRPVDGTDFDGVSEEMWIRKRFEELVASHGEIEVPSGAILHLGGSSGSQGQGLASKPDLAGRGGDTLAMLPQKAAKTAASALTQSAVPKDGSPFDNAVEDTCEVFCVTEGVFEVDLGLDDMYIDDPLPGGRRQGAGFSSAAAPSAEVPKEAMMSVQVMFLVGANRQGAIGDASLPPYARISSRSLAEDVELSVGPALAPKEEGKIQPRPHLHSIAALCAAMPADAGSAWREEDGDALADAVQIIGAESESQVDKPSLDSLPLFESAATELRSWVLRQLGCGAADGQDANTSVKSLAAAEQCHPYAVPGVTAVIGGRGSGKTHLSRRVCAALSQDGVLALEVACGKLGQPSNKFKDIQRWIKALLQIACWHGPSILLLDDMGALFPDVEQGAPNLSILEERSAILAEQFMDLLIHVRCSGARVAVIGTMPSDAAVHRSLWRAMALEHKVTVRSPELKERTAILQTLCRLRQGAGWEVDSALLQEGGFDDWAGRIDGYSVGDLCALVDRACTEAEADAGVAWGLPRKLAAKDLEAALESFVPAAMADQSFFTSNVRWSDVGGMNAAKEALLGMLTIPTKYAVLVDRAPVKTRRGLMLVGPPGCGKTFLVHAAATETKGLLRFLTVKGPELLSKYIGASEAGVRQVFERAAAAAPSVIFFDEIEALAPKRGGDSTGVTDRVVNQMLTYLDGVDDRGRVYVVGASSRPDMVDAALMRPGRFDKICYCGLPSFEEKVEICTILATKHGFEATSPAGADADATSQIESELKSLVAMLPRLFTCADLFALFATAKIGAVNDALRERASGDPKVSVKPILNIGHLKTA